MRRTYPAGGTIAGGLKTLPRPRPIASQLPTLDTLCCHKPRHAHPTNAAQKEPTLPMARLILNIAGAPMI